MNLVTGKNKVSRVLRAKLIHNGWKKGGKEACDIIYPAQKTNVWLSSLDFFFLQRNDLTRRTPGYIVVAASERVNFPYDTYNRWSDACTRARHCSFRGIIIAGNILFCRWIRSRSICSLWRTRDALWTARLMSTQRYFYYFHYFFLTLQVFA